jgi:hypothetical protein
MPAGHDERRREGMGRPFFKNAERRVGGLGIVQFPERVNQEDVEDTGRTADVMRHLYEVASLVQDPSRLADQNLATE